MTEKYEIKTYGMGRTMLDAGWYTAQDLIKVIEGMGMLNQHARAQIDAVMLSSDPAGLKPKAKREERMSYEELETDRDRMKTARDSLMLSNANLKAENHDLKNRKWVGLTDKERKEIMRYEKDFWGVSGWEWKCMEAVEAKLKEKNT